MTMGRANEIKKSIRIGIGLLALALAVLVTACGDKNAPGFASDQSNARNRLPHEPTRVLDRFNS